MTDKHFFGVVSVFLAFAAYAPYFYSIWRKRTRPHIFSWIIWGSVDSIACAAQLSAGAGAGAWAAGATGLFGYAIVFLAARTDGDRHIVKSDWVALALGLAGIVLWQLTADPLWAVVLAALVNYLGAWPTLRKSWHRPTEEAAVTYALCCLRSLVALFALDVYSFTTLFYPLTVMSENGAIVAALLYRRAVLDRAKG